jgi:type IV secretory pathway TraG/TraD family ATPase VirD4
MSGSVGGGWKSTRCLTNTWQLAGRLPDGLQLTEVLFHWPGAAVIVDPKAEQYKRTADFRQRYLGPVYHLPGHQVQLARYYDFLDPDDIQELHDQLLRPDEDMQRIFADKSLPLFRAVGHFARARKLDPLRVLLDAAEDDFQRVLVGLDSVPAAHPFVRQFTNGQPPDKVTSADRFVSSAYGTFATRLFAYQKHIDTICPRLLHNTLPRQWAAQKSSLYITYSLNELEGVGGVVAAILAGLMRDHMANGQKRRLLVAIDEMAAVRLRHLDTYLATVGGYGITTVLYAQSTSQLEGIYGRAGAQAILANCAHQLWYPPNDFQTAQHISDLYGTTLKPSRSYSTVSRMIQQENGQMRTIPQQSVSESLVEGPTYSPSEVRALDKDRVFVFTEKEQRFRFVGQRLDPRSLFEKLPEPPSLPILPKIPRRYTEWLAVAEAEEEAVVKAEASSADKTETDSTTSDTHTTSETAAVTPEASASDEAPLPSEPAAALPEDVEASVVESSGEATVPNTTAEETPALDEDDDERTLL